VTGLITPFAAAKEGRDREEVIDALNVALFAGDAITIPRVRRSYARNRGPQTFARLYWRCPDTHSDAGIPERTLEKDE
jgi:hypothetical protein